VRQDSDVVPVGQMPSTFHPLAMLVRDGDEQQRQTRWIPFARSFRAVPHGVTRRNHTWVIRHLARPIRDVASRRLI